MSDVTVKNFDQLDSYQGPGAAPGQFRYAGKSLGVTAWAMNLLVLPPAWPDYPEHDHAKDGQEEVYVVLEGEATLRAGADSWQLVPGTMARVGPAQKRTIVPGPAGATILVMGGVAGEQ